MTEYGDASFLFPHYESTTLFVDDVLVPITRVKHEQCGTLGTRVDFEARADDGRELLGSLYTTQDFDDVVKLIEEALDAGELIEIRGRQAATQVPGTSRFWVAGEIHIGSGSFQRPCACLPQTLKTLN
ncbi:hypothetical protein GR200_20750 [Rhizobium leguminosarum]|uniref:hypothetical protein n=1 Tax=Rhizobium leguminosarum TaxID=384 RepID=UPI0013B8F555|nr:hypothetical protein [Rhizobium leguminosarum]NEI57472.1 hypothetical protein [Rhizobium leguminosarum]NEI86332.1 hypothetical protein [Rhizobium leguminosarum]